MSGHVTHELLKGFLEAFNRHDLDSIMDYFAEDCVFYMPRGSAPEVTGISGRTRCEQVWRKDSREFRMCITEQISTGCV